MHRMKLVLVLVFIVLTQVFPSPERTFLPLLLPPPPPLLLILDHLTVVILSVTALFQSPSFNSANSFHQALLHTRGVYQFGTHYEHHLAFKVY